MAAISKSLALKRFADQILACGGGGAARLDPSRLFPSGPSRRYSSSYEKEIEEHVRPAVVPDHVIDPGSDNYWGPHPSTGVFGPASAVAEKDAAGGSAAPPPPPPPRNAASGLEQTVRYRPLEDVDKPAYP